MDKNYAAMYKAVIRGEAGTVKKLIRRDRAVLDGVVANNTWLHLAAQKGDVAVIEALVGAGLPVDQLTKDGVSTPLESAAGFGRYQACEWLLEHGADINRGLGESATPIFGAIYSKSLESTPRSQGGVRADAVLHRHKTEGDDLDRAPAGRRGGKGNRARTAGIMLRCPRCGEVALTVVKKWFLGPARSVPCQNCGRPVSASWWLVVIMMSALIGTYVAIDLTTSEFGPDLLWKVVIGLIGLHLLMAACLFIHWCRASHLGLRLRDAVAEQRMMPKIVLRLRGAAATRTYRDRTEPV